MAWDEKSRVTVGGVSLAIPAELVKRSGTTVDSEAAVFEGGGLFVVVTQGPFSDRLTSYIGRSGYREESTRIGEAAGRIVFFRTPEEGTYTVATHSPGVNGLTVLIRAAESVPEQVA